MAGQVVKWRHKDDQQMTVISQEGDKVKVAHSNYDGEPGESTINATALVGVPS